MNTRAFTLIEVVIGLAISAIITTAAVAVVAQANRAQVEGQVRAQLEGDARLVTTMMQHDLQYLGAGVPRGYRADDNDFTGGTPDDHQLRPLIRVGQPDNIVFVGDLPYPNADMNGVVQVLDVRGASNDHLYVASPLSPCVPEGVAPNNYHCNNQTAALVPGPTAAGQFPAGDKCSKSAGVTRLCPWKMNKWEAGTVNHVRLVVGAPAGSWYERETNLGTATDNDYFGIQLSSGAGSFNTFDTTQAADLGNQNIADPLFSKSPGAFAATIDRVFWSWESATAAGSPCPPASSNCVLMRRQCWGAVVDPANVNWPAVSNNNFRSTQTPTDCNPVNDEGTPWETVATGVSQFNVTYLDKNNLPVTQPWSLSQSAAVHAVLVDLQLTKSVPSTTTTTAYSLRRKYFLENRGGLVDEPPPQPPPPGPPPPPHHGSHHGGGGGCHGDSCGGDHG